MTDEAFALALVFLRRAEPRLKRFMGNVRVVQEPMRHANIRSAL